VSDATLERWFGRRWLLALAFHAVAWRYRPSVRPGFSGTIVFEVTRPQAGDFAFAYTLDVHGSRAVSSAGAAREPDVRVVVPVADLVRIAGGRLDPAEPMLQGRATFTGDLELASLLPEMFGAPALR
jgi:hypothetical protein